MSARILRGYTDNGKPHVAGLFGGTILVAGRISELKHHKLGAPNPFVVGGANYAKFLGVMAECIQANIARGEE